MKTNQGKMGLNQTQNEGPEPRNWVLHPGEVASREALSASPLLLFPSWRLFPITGGREIVSMSIHLGYGSDLNG